MEYKQINDYEVMYMIRESDEEARDFMIKKYVPIINKLALKYYDFAKKCGCEFQDLVQEGLIALNKSINSYNESSNALFYTYACICIERHFITYCRSINSNRHMPLNLNIGDDYLLNLEDESATIDVATNNRILKEKFIYYKNLFTLEHSSVFELRYNGFTYKEISCLLDVPISTIDGRLSKIRKVLQEKEKIFRLV